MILYSNIDSARFDPTVKIYLLFPHKVFEAEVFQFELPFCQVLENHLPASHSLPEFYFKQFGTWKPFKWSSGRNGGRPPIKHVCI